MIFFLVNVGHLCWIDCITIFNLGLHRNINNVTSKNSWVINNQMVMIMNQYVHISHVFSRENEPQLKKAYHLGESKTFNLNQTYAICNSCTSRSRMGVCYTFLNARCSPKVQSPIRNYDSWKHWWVHVKIRLIENYVWASVHEYGNLLKVMFKILKFSSPCL